MYLYNNGDQCTSITGGWNEALDDNDGTNQVSDWTTSPYLGWQFWEFDSGYTITSSRTAKTIDVTPYTKLCATARVYHRYGTEVKFNIALSDRAYECPSGITAIGEGNTVTRTIVWDISSISGYHTVDLLTWLAPSGIIDVRIYEVWLE